jgi:hypothetical protein
MLSLLLSATLLLPFDDPKVPCTHCICGCTETGKCTCKDCDHPQLVKAQAVQPVLKTGECPALVADPSKGRSIDDAWGHQIGWLGNDGVYQPYDRQRDVFGPPCPCPAQAAPVWSSSGGYSFGAAPGGCASGSCGSAATGRAGIFRRR